MSVDVRREGRVALITVNRPEALNALSSAILEELHEELTAMKRDDDVGAIVLTGAGEKSFIAGADIHELATKTALQAREYAELGQEVAHMLETIRKATIAAVNGYALGGGCEMALACDIRLASDRAVFGQPEINLGIIPGFGGTQRLPRLVGPSKALEMNLIGDAVSADEAYEFGLVNRVVPDHELFDTALAWARKLGGQAPLAVEQVKQVSLKGDLDEGIEAEKAGFAAVFGSEDAKEGIGAFLGKRSPKWQGR